MLSMRRCSSSSLQFQFLATTMSLRPPYKGGRGRNQYRRGFSDRTSDDGRDQFINGDSHLRSVRDSNQSFRPPARGSFTPLPPPFSSPPPPSNYRPPQFNSRPPDQSRSSRPPGFNQNQRQFRPRPQKPLDYRNWEYARMPPPADCGNQWPLMLNY